MCTVSFSPNARGFVLGMNRDEKLTRVAGLPPERRALDGRIALFPSEPGGGTWIGVNDAGVCLALINWYSVTASAPAPAVSRGDVVTAALASDSSIGVEEIVKRLPLARINPFRLIGIFPEAREVFEWRWNLRQLEPFAHPWTANAWFSSGHDEPGAQQTRGKVFAQSLRAPDVGSLDWVRRLHRSHAPERGPYSTCMHRADAASVSYTEVDVADGKQIMRYAGSSPCCSTDESLRQMSL